MKKSQFCKNIPALFALTLLLFSAWSPSVYADDAWTKLGRGFGNLAFGALEICRQPSELAKNQRWPIAVAGGVPKGILYFVARELVGVYEIVTFPIPLPSGYRTIMEPDFIIPSD